MKYGDLIDAGIITRADLPRAWAGFPSLVLPVEGEIDFYDVMYRRYANREIGGDTPAVFLRFLNEETLNLLEMLPHGLFANVLSDMVADATEETRTTGGQDTNNITRSASGSMTHTANNKQTTTNTLQGNETVSVDADGTRNTTTNNTQNTDVTRDASTTATQTTDATTTADRSTTQRAAPDGLVWTAYSTGGETATDSDTTNTTTETTASEEVTTNTAAETTETEMVTTTDDSVTTKTATNTNNGSVTDAVDEKDITSDSGTETASRQHNTTESVKRSGAQSGDMSRAYAILRDGKPLVMWIADRYNACFMGVY